MFSAEFINGVASQPEIMIASVGINLQTVPDTAMTWSMPIGSRCRCSFRRIGHMKPAVVVYWLADQCKPAKD
jgi:hypothetical protein